MLTTKPTSVRWLVVGNSPTALDIATLVIAVLGFFVSGISLTWQVLQHVLSGDRVSVEFAVGRLQRGCCGCRAHPCGIT